MPNSAVNWIAEPLIRLLSTSFVHQILGKSYEPLYAPCVCACFYVAGPT